MCIERRNVARELASLVVPSLLLFMLAACDTASVHLPEWTLTPELRIGKEGSHEYALTDVRSLAVGQDGSVFVLQPVDGVVRVYDRTGAFLRYVGRSGDGPGEFGPLVNLGFRGDTLWVSDRSRISLFAPDGRFVRSSMTRYDPKGPNLSPGGVHNVLEDGSFAMLPSFAPTVDRSTWPPGLPLQRVHEQGTVQAVLCLFDLSVIRTYVGPDDRPRIALLPLHPLVVYGYWPDGMGVVCVAQDDTKSSDPSTFRVSRIDLDGDTVVTRRVEYEPIAVSETVHDSLATRLCSLSKPDSADWSGRGPTARGAHTEPLPTGRVCSGGRRWHHMARSAGPFTAALARP